MDKLYVPKQIVPAVSKKEFLIVLLFFGKFSMHLRTSLYNSNSKALPHCYIKVFFSPTIDWVICLNSRTRLLFIFPLTLFTNFSVVIAISLTVAILNVLLKLELAMIVNSNKKSGFKDHCFLSVCSFDDFTVLNRESYKFKRLVK